MCVPIKQFAFSKPQNEPLNSSPLPDPETLAKIQGDPAAWLESYGVTYDPRLPEPFVRFKPFPRQVELLRWLAEREANAEDGLIEKSRDMGLTYLCCAYALHGWLFRPGFKAGFGSRKLELVDRIGDPDCIFEKIRILLRNLPPWQLPAGFKWSEHDNYCKLLNPATGATITGEGGDQIGRGGRSSIMFLDEAAFLEHPQLVDGSLSQTTRCRIDVSTPNGPGNPFAMKRQSGKVPVFTFHWKDDPRKGPEWYAKEKARLDPVTLAQEVDIDYTASVEGITIPAAWVRAAVGLELPESAPVAGLDIAEEGKSRSVFIVRRGPVVRAEDIVDWGQCNTTETAWRAADETEKRAITTLNYDCGGLGLGVKGTWESATERKLKFKPNGINSGQSPTETRWPDGKTSKERFLNLRAELWFLLRARFERTFEHVSGKAVHPPEEMISIPAHPQLIAELSTPLHFRTETGKLKIEAKADMARRGVKSPDFGDALALTLIEDAPWAFY